jgi:hypothetical protein
MKKRKVGYIWALCPPSPKIFSKLKVRMEKNINIYLEDFMLMLFAAQTLIFLFNKRCALRMV